MTLTKDEILNELDNLRHELDYYELYEPNNEEEINNLCNRMDNLKDELEKFG